MGVRSDGSGEIECTHLAFHFDLFLILGQCQCEVQDSHMVKRLLKRPDFRIYYTTDILLDAIGDLY